MLAEIPSSAIVVAKSQHAIQSHKSGDISFSHLQHTHNQLFCNIFLSVTETRVGEHVACTYNQILQYESDTKRPQLRK